MQRPDSVGVNRLIDARQAGIARPAGRGLRFHEGVWRWRDSLRRRMLALADAIAVLVAIVAVDFLTSADVQQAFWAALFLPVWLVLAKLFGLYDRDHTALRHLTVDELPALCLWALSGTGATT